jgi:hypothetical protein
MAVVSRSRMVGRGVCAALVGVTLGTYAASRLRLSRQLGNRVLDVLDLDEPLGPRTQPTR